MLEDLSGPELDAVIASMSDDELRHWVDELDDGTLGSGGAVNAAASCGT